MKQLLLLILAAVGLMAADATGTWTGSLIIMQDGVAQDRPAHLVLKQDGTKITGTAGPNADEQHPIEGGQVNDGTITFSLPRGESVMKFTLKLDGDEIKGDITREREGRSETAKLAVKRQ